MIAAGMSSHTAPPIASAGVGVSVPSSRRRSHWMSVASGLAMRMCARSSDFSCTSCSG